jgi:hypothetical protein
LCRTLARRIPERISGRSEMRGSLATQATLARVYERVKVLDSSIDISFHSSSSYWGSEATRGAGIVSCREGRRLIRTEAGIMLEELDLNEGSHTFVYDT